MQAYFSLFNNNSDYLYSFSPFPGIGVKFHSFQQIKSDKSDNNSFLVAFCTDG